MPQKSGTLRRPLPPFFHKERDKVALALVMKVKRLLQSDVENYPISKLPQGLTREGGIIYKGKVYGLVGEDTQQSEDVVVYFPKDAESVTRIKVKLNLLKEIKQYIADHDELWDLIG